MTNRFVEMSAELRHGSAPTAPRLRTLGNGYGSTAGLSGSQSVWATPFAASDRVLIILIENGGVDLGIPALVDKIASVLPGSSLIPASVKAQMVSYLRDKIKAATDKLLEDFELSLNRYSAAKPGLFGDVVVLRDGSASYEALKRQLIASSRAGKMIDLIILTHGSGNYISVTGGIDGAKIRAIKAEHGAPLTIRSVYMMNCVGSSLNQAWLDAGAKVSSGSIKNNYLPEPTTYFFWKAWKEGTPFGTAATGAYQQTISLMNGVIRGFVSSLGIVPAMLASRIDVKTWDFVKESAPTVQGQADVTISSDSLSFSKSVAEGLATTVIPVADLPKVASGNGHGSGPARRAVSAEGIALLKSFEPFHAALYADRAGRCAIGHGTVLHDGACDGRPIEGPYTNGIAAEKAAELVADDANEAQQVVHAAVSVPLNQNQLDALISLVSDIGGRAFQDSTLLRELNEGRHDAVPVEIRKWTKARRDGQVVDVPELAKRREIEASLYARAASAAAQSVAFSIDGGYAAGFDAFDKKIRGALHPIRQPSLATCWAAVFTMMYSWWKEAPTALPIRDALATVGQAFVDRFDRGQSIDPAAAQQLYDTAGLVRITSFNPTLQRWGELIDLYGPLYVDVGFGESNMTHAIIVTGIFGTGSPDGVGTKIRYVDPDDGQTHDQDFLDFIKHYEAPGAVRWPHVIVHWPPKPRVSAQSLLVGRSHVYESPSQLVTEQSRFSMAQNPGVVVAGIAVADAAQIGLAAIGLVQAQVAASQGSFSLTYDKAQRLLTTEARAQMPGSQTTKQTYSRRLFYFQIARWNTAKADVIIEWEGNPYGEIGTPVIRRNLGTSTEWSKSSANTTITKLDKIPLPNTDPRAWPIVYSYEGTFDPLGNGYFEFSGEFEINAFGGLKFNRHEVHSRSLADFALGGTPEGKVQRGADNIVPVPTIPQEQIAYLRTRLP